MIDERYQVSAVSIESGERITGMLCRTFVDGKLKNGYGIQTFDAFKMECFEIDPATIEPVRVKPIKRNKHDEWNCPNCNSEFSDIGGINEMYYESEKYDFCPDCGMALDWTE